ncbi:MAG: hypothetical protein WCF67_09635 [Chitinophagaceae bacterium]
MAKEKIIGNCARLAGILLLGAAVPHATFGFAEVVTSIKTGDVRAGMADTFRIIWIYSTIMLVLSGIWTLFLASELRQLKWRAWWQGIFIGIGYTAGSIACMYIAGVYIHLMAFALIGLLLLTPLLIWARSFGKNHQKLVLPT